MKYFLSSFLQLFLMLMLCFHSINACTVEIEPLRKTFRRSKAVFLAEVKEIKLKPNADYNKSLVDGEVTFEVSNSWKGNYKNQIKLLANVGFPCGCSSFDEFKVGQQYIVFVDKESVANFCDSQKAKTEYGLTTAKRLDKFWFRTWARIYPF